MSTHQRFLLPSMVFLLYFAFFSLSLGQEELPAIVKRIEPSTVVILPYDKEGEMLGQGSGFFISPDGDVITNWHVLQGASRAEVKTAEGKVYPITQIVAEDKEGDIVRVSVDIPLKLVRPLSVSASIPEVGERVIVIGSPLGLERTQTLHRSDWNLQAGDPHQPRLCQGAHRSGRVLWRTRTLSGHCAPVVTKLRIGIRCQGARNRAI